MVVVVVVVVVVAVVAALVVILLAPVLFPFFFCPCICLRAKENRTVWVRRTYWQLSSCNGEKSRKGGGLSWFMIGCVAGLHTGGAEHPAWGLQTVRDSALFSSRLWFLNSQHYPLKVISNLKSTRFLSRETEK